MSMQQLPNEQLADLARQGAEAMAQGATDKRIPAVLVEVSRRLRHAEEPSQYSSHCAGIASDSLTNFDRAAEQCRPATPPPTPEPTPTPPPARGELGQLADSVQALAQAVRVIAKQQRRS